MNRKDVMKVLALAGVILLALLLIGGCAKKQVAPPPEPPPPPPPMPDTTGQAARQAAERAAALEKARQDSIAAAMQAEQAAKASLQVIYFDFDKYNLRPDARATAELDAGVLAKYPKWMVMITGNCDERGTEEYNLALGERRANAVRDFFIQYGIAAERLSTISYGEERPADPGHNEAAWAKNRRCELVVQ